MSDYPNSGTMKRNDKRKTDKHPEFTGQLSVTCPHCNHASEFWLSSWVREAKATGRKFFSLALKPKEAPRQTPDENKARLKEGVAKATSGEDQPPDDEVPF